ncbi:MAG: serine--tRNA ligase, partial [Candidatus Nitrosopolaris sp.]
MLDPKLLRENPELVRGMLANRKFEFPLDHLIALDKRRRELILQVEKFKHRKNLLARVISTKIKNHQDTVPEREEMTGIGAELADIEQEKKTLDAKFRTSMMTLPNLINKSVPIGSDEKENVILRYHGAITNFDFFLKDHVDIANSLGLLDIE